MTTPGIHQVSTLSGAQGENVAPQVIGDPDEPGVFTKKYSRVYEHYISNNMTASGYTETLAGQLVGNWQLDEGWQLIPYWNPAVAMTATEAAEIPLISQAVKVKSLGFRIIHGQMFRTEKNVIAGVTSLSNTFCDNPYAEVFEDNRHEFDYLLQDKDATPTQQPYGVQINYPNTDMKNNEVASIAEGSLKRVKWAFNRRIAPADPADYETLLMRQAGEGAWAAASTLNHGARKKLGINDLSGHGYTWTNKNNGWHPHALPQGSLAGQTVNNIGADVPFLWPQSRAKLLAGTTPDFGPAQFARGVNVPNAKYGHWNRVNYSVGTESANNNQPVDHYIKLQRLHDMEGPMTLHAKILVEYTCVLAFQPRAEIWAHPQYTFTPPVTAGTFEDWGVVKYAVSGRVRDFEPYGIPAYSATQPTREGVARYDIYQDASVGPVASTSKRANDKGDGEVPAKRQYAPIE